jgi:2-hydroxychromene-2-carboxylate isomerase
MRKADWYFDFISPFAYLAWMRLGELPADLEVRHRPILFAALLNHWDNKGPAEMSTKRAWTYRWCTWLASQQSIELRFPSVHPFNPKNSPRAIDAIFKSVWTTGGDPSDPDTFNALAKSLDVDPAQLGASEVKDALRSETDAAIQQGVFGVPTLVIDNELFWGSDAMEFAAAYHKDPSILGTAEMQRVAAIPVGVTRKTG